MSLRPPQAVKYINTWLSRNDYAGLFENDLSLLLSENRRSRRSNIVKYGAIPFKKDMNNRIAYDLPDLQNFCDNQLKPICEKLDKIRAAKADKAASTARLPYVN